jgi:hypothetical protein
MGKWLSASKHFTNSFNGCGSAFFPGGRTVRTVCRGGNNMIDITLMGVASLSHIQKSIIVHAAQIRASCENLIKFLGAGRHGV